MFLMYNFGRLVALVYIRQPLQHRGGAKRRVGAKLDRRLRPYDGSRCAEHGGCSCTWYGVRVPPGIVMVAPQTLLRKAEGAQSKGRAKDGVLKSAAKDSIKALAPKDPGPHSGK